MTPLSREKIEELAFSMARQAMAESYFQWKMLGQEFSRMAVGLRLYEVTLNLKDGTSKTQLVWSLNEETDNVGWLKLQATQNAGISPLDVVSVYISLPLPMERDPIVSAAMPKIERVVFTSIKPYWDRLVDLIVERNKNVKSHDELIGDLNVAREVFDNYIASEISLICPGTGMEIVAIPALLKVWNQSMERRGWIQGGLSGAQEEAAYMWRTQKDERTCRKCMALDGKIFKVVEIKRLFPYSDWDSSGINILGKAHPWCRCLLVPTRTG